MQWHIGEPQGSGPRAPETVIGDAHIVIYFSRTPPKRKRTNSRWPRMGINYSANRPDPDCPGGLGAEESGAERTGPTQTYLLAIQKGGRWAEVGRYYDSANDPVTVSRLAPGRGRSAGHEFKDTRRDPLAAARGWRDHVVFGMIPKSGIRFSENIMPEMTTGGAR
jgi:hypothetical protein